MKTTTTIRGMILKVPSAEHRTKVLYMSNRSHILYIYAYIIWLM